MSSCIALGSPAAAAPKYLGPNKCVSCHEHETLKAWADKDKHSRALQQLDDAKAAKYAAAIGLSDPYDLKGSCVTCHATVFSGDANAGVSCEKCHGPGSDYLAPHQEKGNYAKAVSLGMIDTRGNYPVWAALCVNCHVVTDAKLTGAGHKSGANFETGAESRKIVHWKETYDFARLAAAGKAAVARRAGGAPPPAAAAPKVTPSPVATKSPVPTKPPKPTPTASPVAKEPRATPTSAAPARPEAARSPTAAPPRREPPTPTSVPREAPTSVPSPTSTFAPEAPPTEVPSPVPARVTPTPATTRATSDILILIQATPIPTTTPRARERREPTSIPAAVETPMPSSAPAAAPPPTRAATKPRPKPPLVRRTRAPVRPTSVASPPTIRRSPTPVPAAAPSPTRTRVRAPLEPPRRPPH
ncbi:MAG TPA: multiheme c-type cytochrome [Thermoanaerobaculia bacterium]|nr:multiheme c-type cytochrome [Thermoanaerobaculia bacterium]HEV8609535.1 multiheme c-type cytochrome [Thermoanaerobaculia bacterium]